MALQDLKITIKDTEIPHHIAEFLEEADRRIENFKDPAKAMEFIPSDYDRVYCALRVLVDEDMTSGSNFCEWGSGFGVVAGLAALMEFDSYGIELNSELVIESQELLAEFGLDVEVACGSFIPQDSQSVADSMNDFAWLEVNAGSAHEELEIDPDEFDVIFAYPWPGEDRLLIKIFDKIASVGALFLTYHGIDDIRLRRKVS
ncbi:MAG: hypothetical protein QGF00_19400 [Planctomycetota bacterium]|jgi:hypothetical protein|nr:hypothetical protein [Planctomycetota bacterium]MDP7251784.1 hypothetical protein [Planctomycetota bacterium]